MFMSVLESNEFHLKLTNLNSIFKYLVKLGLHTKFVIYLFFLERKIPCNTSRFGGTNLIIYIFKLDLVKDVGSLVDKMC